MTDITVAVSERTFQRMFRVLRDNFVFAAQGTLPGTYVDISWDVRCHLENGQVRLQGDNSVKLEELDIVVDRCRLTFGIDLPRVCVGGQCIVRNPLTGNCLVRLPRLCVFAANPDVSLTLNVDGLFRSEVTASCRLYTEYYENPNRPDSISDVEAALGGVGNEWQVYLKPLSIDVDHFDMAGSAQAAYDAALAQAVNHALGALPAWARDVVQSLLGPIGNVIEAQLDMPEDIDEWLSDLFNVSTGLADGIYDSIVSYFADLKAIHHFGDPLEIMPAKSSMIPVYTSLLFVRAECNSKEMLITADAGLI
jgi:hypothetical protein